MPRTKIVATLGPASNNYSMLRKMTAAGLDVVRLNFSHGTDEQHLESVNLIRRINQKYVGSEAYIIENGNLTGPAASPTIEITTNGSLVTLNWDAPANHTPTGYVNGASDDGRNEERYRGAAGPATAH